MTYVLIGKAGVKNAVVLFAAGSGDSWHIALGNMTRTAVKKEVDALRGCYRRRAIWIYERPSEHPDGRVITAPAKS